MKEAHPDFETADKALAYAIEGYCRAISDLASMDGFSSFYVIEETERTLRAVGLSYFLPSGHLPIELRFKATESEVTFVARVGRNDEKWSDMTEKKQWSSVYLFATEHHAPNWNWAQPIAGSLRSK
ncbi:MAG: hypothetical protein AAGK17_02035 [Pseudomonadota bacterium]